MTDQKRLNYDDLHDMCSIREVCQYLGVSRQAVNQAIARGSLEAIHFGHRVIVPKGNLPRPDAKTWSA